MFYFYLSRKIFSSFLSVLIIAIFLQVSHAASIDKNMNINNLSIGSKDASKINGSFSIKNNTDNVFPELWYSTELFLDFSPSNSNLVNTSSTTFSIKKQENLTFNFTHTILSKIPEANYTLVIRVYTRTNEVIAFKKFSLGKMGTDSDFLQVDFENTYFSNKTKNNLALEGPTHSPNEVPVLKTFITNNGATIVATHPKITVYKRCIYLDPKPISEFVSKDEFVFKPGEKKEVLLNLPAFSLPESYYARIIFVDNTNVPISGNIEARYVVSGISAKIIGASAKYLDGKLIISQEIAGPADESKMSAATAQIETYDVNGVKIFEDSKSIDLNNTSQMLSFEKSIQLENGPIKIVHKVSYNNKILDTFTLEYNTSDISMASTDTNEISQNQNSSNSLSESNSTHNYILIIILLLVVLLTILFYFLKNRNF